MAGGLGMTPEEWSELRAQVDDSFWVLRIIGSFIYALFGFENYNIFQDILRFPTTRMVFRVEHTSEENQIIE